MTALEFIGFDPADWHDFAGPLHQVSFSADGSEGRRQALLDIGKMDERQRLIDDPALIPKAVDKFLRFEAPVHAFSRNVMANTEIGGQTIRAGERVYMLWASANRDPDQFENPDEVDFERKPNRHLTFGIGAHRCLGAQLARMELRIMLEEILRRIPDFRVDLEKVRQPTSVTIIWGRTSLPATFTPAALA